MQAHELDQAHNLRLRAPDPNPPAAGAEPAGHHGQVDHQRRVGEDQLVQIHDDVGARVNRPSECTTAHALR